jgi:uncharacterized protein (TIGR03118 family)
MRSVLARGLAVTGVVAGLVGAGGARAALASDQYLAHNMVSNDTTIVPADRADPLLVNPWGLVAGTGTPWWPANNGSNTSTITPASNVPNGTKVSVPAPTGIVFNSVGNFQVGGANTNFLFASENGGLYARTNLPAALVGVAPPAGADHPIYKGLALAGTGAAAKLYATDFHNGKVDVFDNHWTSIQVPGRFADAQIPAGYAPYGIQTTGNRIFVSYAQQDADREDEIPGAGKGYVDAFDFDGNLLGRVAAAGPLSAPWGLAQAPTNFGSFSGDYLVGNFGDGRINAYKETAPGVWTFDGTLQAAGGAGPLVIPGLWALEFGLGSLNANGTTNTLYFTAGPLDETAGVFGRIVASEPLGVTANVPAQLGLSLGSPASFGAFTPGVAKDYTANTTANVVSTAGDGALSVSDASTNAPGHLVNGAFSLPQAVQAQATSAGGTGSANFAPVSGNPTTLLTYTGPVSNDVVTMSFKQSIGAGDALRTGSYSKTLTFTLSTTNP